MYCIVMPKLCLNMIVKNEQRVITRLLESVVNLIDTYCICDTGSTDDTIKTIKEFFQKRNIDGYIEEHEFRDFSYSRNKALDMCKKREDVDYILLLDADMILQTHITDIAEWKHNLNKDVYHLLQGNDQFQYKNVRIVRNRPEISYWGVTHEYLQCPPDTQYETIKKSELFILDIGDGGAKHDKFTRDIRLLKQGLIDHPNNDRYTFYLANSYMDSGQYHGAIETYNKRIKIGGWKQEVWFSYYSIGKAYRELNNIEMAIHSWMEGYNYFPDRIENLYQIVHHYRCQGKYRLAYWFYKMAETSRKLYATEEHLFMEKDIYDYKLDYESSLIHFYCELDKEPIIPKILSLFNNPMVPKEIMQNIWENYKFYAPVLSKLGTSNDKWITIWNETINELKKKLFTGFSNSTPTLVSWDNKIGLIVRCVNYEIDEHGGYVNRQQIVSENRWYVWEQQTKKKILEDIIKYDKQHDGLYVGLEDMRLQENNGKLMYNSNRGLGSNSIQVEIGTLRENGVTFFSKLLSTEGESKPVEKNWVSYVNEGILQYIYSWHKLQQGSLEQNKLIIKRKQETPLLFESLRGSSNGVIINDELWFLAHSVVFEPRRRYYHYWIVLDKEGTIKKYSCPFSFDGDIVEYSNGFFYDNKTNNIYIGYSVLDRETKFLCINYSHLVNHLLFFTI